ncbi:MAG: hypothetical protein MR283_06270 [Erysipelotrichaceae bacterium]|nr:hypothetical protein [Erysipelotrichaceae bacterium]MDY6034574.1 hypothetical protein [Bulleidia sp.]
MGIGGAISLFESFTDTSYEDEYTCIQGLNVFSDFAVDMQYEEDEQHLAGINRKIKDEVNSVVAIPKNSGMLIVDGEFTLLGDSFVLNSSNLDVIYAAYDTYRYDY